MHYYKLGNKRSDLKTTMISEGLPPLPEKVIALLQQQKITETEPGTILQDFQTLLDFVGEKGIPVSGKQNLLPMKSLAS